VNIITWNANRKKRYDLIWTDTLVKRWAWDVICLQEAGNPAREWGNPQKGRAWQAKKQRKPSDEPLEARWYTYTPPGFPQVYIVHGQWVNHDKNHLVIITKMAGTLGGRFVGPSGPASDARHCNQADLAG
jgi:hypothetical protein